MIILNCWHPDVVEFVGSKREMGKITNANISVGITDKFMDAVHADADWDLFFPDVSDPDYETLGDGNLEKCQDASRKAGVPGNVQAADARNWVYGAALSSAEAGAIIIAAWDCIASA